jgi:hypothetical protein
VQYDLGKAKATDLEEFRCLHFYRGGVMKDVTHAGQLKVLQDLLKIKETDGILRVFGNKGSDYYALEGYWYFQRKGRRI